MKSYGAKILLYAALVAVCVFFGIDMATSGMERIGGPAVRPSQTAVVTPSPVAPSLPAPAEKPVKPAETASAIPSVSASAVAAEPSFINRAFLQFGDGLRYAARGTIRFVVSVFSAVIH